MDKIMLHKGDCLEIMPTLPADSVDMVLCDLPYGTVNCKWDIIIDLDSLWSQYNRITKKNAAVVLFSQQPFSSKLIMSNLSNYKYDWVWAKENAANFLNKKIQPGKITENINVFYKKQPTYNPQLTTGKPYKMISGRQKRDTLYHPIKQVQTSNCGTRLPNNILYFNKDTNKLHPTQKPVELLKYLIKTYTNPGDLVLDNCMGSGSTGVACVETGRQFIGIEKEQEYFEIAQRQIYDFVDKTKAYVDCTGNVHKPTKSNTTVQSYFYF